MKYCICYLETATNRQTYMLENSVSTFQAAHPNDRIMMVFRTEDDIETKEEQQRRMFQQNQAKYNITTMYRQKLIGPPGTKSDGQILSLIGFLPRCRKYRYLIEDTVTKRRYKVNRNYLEDGIERYQTQYAES